MTPREREEFQKERENEAIEKIINKARTAMQMSCISMQSEHVFKIY